MERGCRGLIKIISSQTVYVIARHEAISEFTTENKKILNFRSGFFICKVEISPLVEMEQPYLFNYYANAALTWSAAS